LPVPTRPVMGATVTVKVDGNPVPESLTRYLDEFVFEDSLHVPDMIELRYTDPNRGYPQGTPFAIGKQLTVQLRAPGIEPTDFKAEITSLIGHYTGSVYTFTVRAMDSLHRLHRGRWTATYENKLMSDVFKTIVESHGLTCGDIEATTVTHPHLTLVNESHFTFLHRLAAENGRFLTFTEGKVNLNKRKAPTAPLQLSPQASLIDLEVVVTTSDQTSEVTVHGWDVQAKQVATKTSKVAATPIDMKNQVLASIAGTFQATKSALVIGSPNFGTVAEATAMAEGAAETVGGAFTEIQALSSGQPKLRAGTSIELVEVPPAFLGKFVVSSTRHVLSSHDGYTTEFVVSADQDRSLLAMTGGGGSGSEKGVSGVVPGIVTDNKDPDHMGRVRVAFPWASEDHNSHWARTMLMGGGKDRGITFLPSIDDEVLVAFEDGNPARPVVLGGLHNGVDKFPEHLGDDHTKSGKVQVRGLYSDKQHMEFVDKDGKESITLGMRDKTYVVSIDKGQTTIKVHSDGKVEIDAKDKVTINSKADVMITATSKISFEAKGAVSIKGMGVEIVDTAGASLKLQGQAALKGATVAIN
jgi:uncharacterized protein involved in type VI secretion and phage assembly